MTKHKVTVDGPEYTPAEDINDVRQLVSLVKQRPCIIKGENRGTVIAYSELAMIEKRLKHAMATLHAAEVSKANTTVGNLSKSLEAYIPNPGNNALEAARAMNAEADDNFVRPLGAVDESTPGETYLDRLPSHHVKDILNSMRAFEKRCGAYFNGEAYAAYVKMRPEQALSLLRQFEESGDVMSSVIGSDTLRDRVTLWHVLA